MKTSNKKGFTIIEVVLVLAIAGLIFLVVFLAVPALQRNQRDQQRKSDASRALTTLSNYQSNNRGNLPAGTAAINSFQNNYLKIATEFKSPTTGNAYATAWNSNVNLAQDTVQFAVGSKCNGELLTPGSGRNVAVRVALEGGGIYCTDQ